VGEERRVTVVNGTQARAYVQSADITTDLMSIEPQPESQVQDVTTFGANITGKAYAVTLQTARLVADGYYSSDLVAGIDAILAPLQGLAVAVGLWPAGDAAGSRGYADDDAIFTTYKAVSKVGSVVGVHMEWECNGGAALVSSVVPRTTTVGAATNTTAAVDNGAATTNGGSAFFRLFAGTGAAALTVFRVEHSPDNAAWTTLASSTLVTTGTQRVAIAAGTTIERYTRAVVTVAAGKTAVYNVALQRA
jgi:hypothetical protein